MIRITRDGAPVAYVTNALEWFHRNQGQSMDHAIRYEGYAILEGVKVTTHKTVGQLWEIQYQDSGGTLHTGLWRAESVEDAIAQVFPLPYHFEEINRGEPTSVREWFVWVAE